MAQLKDTIVNGGLRATESVASPIGQFDTIYAKEEVSAGITENYTSGTNGQILQSKALNENDTITYWASLSPIINLTQGTSENGPKIGATIAGVSTLPNDRTEINKATTNIYGVTKLTGLYNASTPNNNLAATGEAIKAAVDTLNSNIPDSSNPNLEIAGANKTLTALSIQSGKIDAATFTEIAIDSSQITSGIGRNTILYGDSTGVIQSAAPAWGDWDNGTAAGPQAKIQIGAITYTSPAIPAASTDISGIVTTEAQSFIGNKSFYSVVDFRATSGEGGEIHLNASDENTSQAGIVLDVRESKFRIFGIASADGETINGVGTPLVIDPYNKTITGGYTLTGHASLDLPLTGGTMTGKITFNNVVNAIAYTGTKNTYDMIKFKDNTTTTDGNGIIIGGAGLTCIGGGESADTVAAQFSSGGSENLCLSNDGAIDFYTNCQNGLSSAVHTSISTTGTYTHEDSGVSYVAGSKGDHAALYAKKAYNQDHWYPAVVLDTKGGGSWQIGNYNDETLEFVYFPKDKRDNNTNSGQTEVYLTSAGEFVGRHNSLNLTNICFDWSGSYSTGSWMLIYNGETGTFGGAKFKAINQANTAAWVDGAHKWTRIGGDTMSGSIRQKLTTVTRGSKPSANQYRTYEFIDNGDKRVAQLEYGMLTNGESRLHMYVLGNATTSTGDEYGGIVVYKTVGVTGNAVTTYNANNGTWTAAAFHGNLTGNVTGDCSGSSGSCTGNAANVTGTVAIDHGGTGATTAAKARQNLFGTSMADTAEYFITINTNWVTGGYVTTTRAAEIIRSKAGGTWSINVTGNAGGAIAKRLSLTKGTNPSSTQWQTYAVCYQTGSGTAVADRIGGFLESSIDANGVTTTSLLAYRYTSGSTAANAFYVTVDKNGNCSYSMSNPAAFRAAISSPYMVTESYPALVPINGTNNWIKIGTANDSYGLLPSQAGGAGSGHNYLGTSSWYWKYAYVDNYYGNWSGSTIPVSKGGTGSTSKSGARTNLGIRAGYIATTGAVAAGSYKDYTISFSPAFASSPIVIPGFSSGTNASGFGKCSVEVTTTSTTGATIRILNGDTTGRSPSLVWIAIGD